MVSVRYAVSDGPSFTLSIEKEFQRRTHWNFFFIELWNYTSHISEEEKTSKKTYIC